MSKSGVAIICFLLGILCIPLCGYVYLRFGHPPVAVTDAAFPMEKAIVHTPLNARIARELPSSVPVQATPENLTAGAVLYKQHCAFCHGIPQQPSIYGDHMYPNAPQLWKSHRNGVVGVSDDPVGETYWKVKNGIRLTGMPAFANLMNDTQMWQVSLLLASADKPLPAVTSELSAPNTTTPQ